MDKIDYNQLDEQDIIHIFGTALAYILQSNEGIFLKFNDYKILLYNDFNEETNTGTLRALDASDEEEFEHGRLVFFHALDDECDIQ